MAEISQKIGMFNAIFTAIADTLAEMAGNVMTRTKTVLNVEGGVFLRVETTNRFASSGRIVVAGEILNFVGKNNSNFLGITQKDGTVGLPFDISPNEVVMDVSRKSSQLEDLRASFVLSTAEDFELDIIARNYGLFRPRGLQDAEFRAVLQVVIYLEAQTIYGIEQVLDALVGAGNYEVWEDLISDIHRVHVRLVPQTTTQFRGKTYLVGLEEQTGLGSAVTVDNPVTFVYGIYDDIDPQRTGTNFALKSFAVTTVAATPKVVIGPPSSFVGGDTRKPVILTRLSGVTEHWRVIALVSSSRLRLGHRRLTNATLSTGDPDIVEADNYRFAAWMVGHQITITSDTPANNGSFVITELIDNQRFNQVRVSGAAFETELNVTWQLEPVFPTEGGQTADLLRGTIAGNTITAPNILPVGTVLVDYVHIPSAQILENEAVIGNDQFPFYLWDEGYIVQTFLDLITAAGVEPVLES